MLLLRNGDRSTDRITSSNSSIVKMLTDNNSSNNTVSSAATKPMASLWHSFLVQHDNQLHKKDGQPVRASVASEGSSGNVFERLHLVDSGKSREEARKDATSKEKSTDNNDRHDNSESMHHFWLLWTISARIVSLFSKNSVSKELNFSHKICISISFLYCPRII